MRTIMAKNAGSIPYNTLLMTPRNVKQYIDWLLRVGMKDIPLNVENTLDSTFDLGDLVERKYGKGDDEKGVKELLSELLGQLSCLVGYCHSKDDCKHCEKPCHTKCQNQSCGTVTGNGLAAVDFYDRSCQTITALHFGKDCPQCKKLQEQLKKFLGDNYGCLLYTLRCAQTVLTGVTFNTNHDCEQNKDNKCGKLHKPTAYLKQLKKELEDFLSGLEHHKGCKVSGVYNFKTHVGKWKTMANDLKEALDGLLKNTELTKKLRQFKKHATNGDTPVETADRSGAFTLRMFVNKLGTFLTTIGRRYSSSYGVQARFPECSKDKKCSGCKGNVSCECGTERDDEKSSDGKWCDQCDLNKCAGNFTQAVQRSHSALKLLKEKFKESKDKGEENSAMHEDPFCSYLKSRNFEPRYICHVEGKDDCQKVPATLDKVIETLEKLKNKLKIADYEIQVRQKK